MSAEQNKASFRRYIEEVWNKGNLGVVDEIASPGLVVHFLPPGTPPGPEPLRRGAASARVTFPDIHINIEDLVAEGDKVVARFTVTGTQLGPYMNDLKTEMPPTGKRISVQAIDIWRFDGDGKWAECWSIYDRLARLQQLGASPAASPTRGEGP